MPSTLERAVAVIHAMPAARKMVIEDENYNLDELPTPMKRAALAESIIPGDGPAALTMRTHEAPGSDHIAALICLCREGGSVKFDPFSDIVDVELMHGWLLRKTARAARAIKKMRAMIPRPSRRCRCHALTLMGDSPFLEYVQEIGNVDLDPLRSLEIVLSDFEISDPEIKKKATHLAIRAALIFLLLRSDSAGKIDLLVREHPRAEALDMRAEVHKILQLKQLDLVYRAMLEARQDQVLPKTKRDHV
jgi:hypothetical protein